MILRFSGDTYLPSTKKNNNTFCQSWFWDYAPSFITSSNSRIRLLLLLTFILFIITFISLPPLPIFPFSLLLPPSSLLPSSSSERSHLSIRFMPTWASWSWCPHWFLYSSAIYREEEENQRPRRISCFILAVVCSPSTPNDFLRL